MTALANQPRADTGAAAVLAWLLSCARGTNAAREVLDLATVGRTTLSQSPKAKEVRMDRYRVPGMTCGHCASVIRRAVKSIDPQAQFLSTPSAMRSWSAARPKKLASPRLSGAPDMKSRRPQLDLESRQGPARPSDVDPLSRVILPGAKIAASAGRRSADIQSGGPLRPLGCRPMNLERAC